MKPFCHRGNPSLIFGPGTLMRLPEIAGTRQPVLILSGRHFAESDSWPALEKVLRAENLRYGHERVSGEPSPEVVDSLAALARDSNASLIVAIGGGSVIDAGKAAAAMACCEGGVAEYLEGVGTRTPTGETLPMIAVPTTAGTGSEATKNAVISRRGPGGFKKSLRHDAFIPSTALVDPELTLGCPPEITLACGLDAFCQLAESYISTKSTPITDALAREGIRHFGRGASLLTDGNFGPDDEILLRSELALAAYYSGLTLANAGLGTVHGLAGPLGACCEVPHGVACGLLFAPVFRRLVSRLTDSREDREVLRRLAEAGAAFSPDDGDADRLPDRLDELAGGFPRLSAWGLERDGIDRVIEDSGNKNFPVHLDADERRAAVEEVF